MKRAQDEYLFAVGFALIVGLFLAVVIWSTGAEGRSANALRFDGASGELAVDSTRAATGSGLSPLTDAAWKPAGADVIPDRPVSVAELAEEAAPQIATQLPAVPPEQTTSTTTFTPTSSETSSIGVPGNLAGPSGWRGGSFAGGGFVGGGGGYYSAGAGAKAATDAGNAEDAPRAVTQSTSRQHLNGAADGPSISTLTPQLAATLDNLVPPAAVFGADATPLAIAAPSSTRFEDSSSIAADAALAAPDPIAKLVESYGDPMALLAQPDLGIEPPSFAITTAESLVANPEPATLLLFGTGLGLIAQRLRRRSTTT